MKNVASALAIALVAVAAGPVRAEFTCSTVAANYMADPNGDPLSSGGFGPEVGVNASGDVLFTGRPLFDKTKIYLYFGAGGGEVVVAGAEMAPNGRAFRSGGAFRSLSLNDAGDLAFVGRFIGGGVGAFVRESGGALETAAAVGGGSPTGGFFSEIPAVSLINASGQLAVVGITDGAGVNGVFLYDSATDTLSTVMQVGDPVGAREVCEFLAVGLGDSGEVVVQGETKSMCSNGFESPVETIFFTAAGSIETAAAVGDAAPAPLGGSTYTSFTDGVFMNASDEILFRAAVAGVRTTVGLFLHDPAGPSTTTIVAKDDAAPVAGAVGTIYGYRLTDAGEAFFRSSVNGGITRRGVFLADGSSPLDTIVTQASAPPLDEFQPGARFRKMLDPAVATDASKVALRADVRDTVSPRGRKAVLRCVP